MYFLQCKGLLIHKQNKNTHVSICNLLLHILDFQIHAFTAAKWIQKPDNLKTNSNVKNSPCITQKLTCKKYWNWQEPIESGWPMSRALTSHPPLPLCSVGLTAAAALSESGDREKQRATLSSPVIFSRNASVAFAWRKKTLMWMWNSSFGEVWWLVVVYISDRGGTVKTNSHFHPLLPPPPPTQTHKQTYTPPPVSSKITTGANTSFRFPKYTWVGNLSGVIHKLARA